MFHPSRLANIERVWGLILFSRFMDLFDSILWNMVSLHKNLRMITNYSKLFIYLLFISIFNWHCSYRMSWLIFFNFNSPNIFRQRHYTGIILPPRIINLFPFN